jgi:hypothetical protein
VVTAAMLPYYGALASVRTAGAADGPAVRRAHGARTAARQRGRGASVGGMHREAGPWLTRGLGQRGALGRRAGRTSRAGRRTAGDAWRTGARHCGVLVPGLKQSAQPNFESKLLQKIE